MVSFVKKINEKSKELKEISKIYYDTANDLLKYINKNSKKNITNTDKKIKEINKEIASIDDKIKSAIQAFNSKKNEEAFLASLKVIDKNIKKIGFKEDVNCLKEFLIDKKLISESKEIDEKKNNLQITPKVRNLGEIKIKFKEGGEYSGKKKENDKILPSKGISEVLIEGKNTSDFTSTDIFSICCFLNKVYNSLKGKIKNINEEIEKFCDDINDLINGIVGEYYEEIDKNVSDKNVSDKNIFNESEMWPEYKIKTDKEKQKIKNYLNALLDELKSLNGDIIKTKEVKITEPGSVEPTKSETSSITENEEGNYIINIEFKQIFNSEFKQVLSFLEIEGFTTFYVIKDGVANEDRFKEGTYEPFIIPNVFFKKKLKIDDNKVSYSLEDFVKDNDETCRKVKVINVNKVVDIINIG
jgi:hypothetical protein